MTRISSSHPPLASLRVFEAAARRGSYKAAAASLNLTASAVSYQIRLLESYLGVQLFERSGRNLVLTSNGTAYSEAVRRVFVDLAEAESLLKGNKRNKSSNIVRVSATPTFAALAAVPNLGKFKAAYPRLDLIIEGRNLSVDLASEPLDAAIHVGTPPLRGLVADRLFRTRMTPLMSPQLAASSSPIRNARDLARFPLIEISKFENLWERWFSEHDPSMQMTKPRIFSDSLSTAIQMADAGLGIILGPFPLVASKVSSGSLVAPIRQFVTLSDTDFLLIYRKTDAQTSKIKAVRKWLDEIVHNLNAEASKLGF